MNDTDETKSHRVSRGAQFVTKGLRLRTRAFIPLALVLLWLAIGSRIEYWGMGVVGLGIMLRLWASGHLHKGGEALTTSGPYAFCRNPLYLGSMLIGVGLAVSIRAYWLAAVVALLFIVLHQVTIRHEESRLRPRYGEAYGEYCENVPRLFPRLRPWEGASNESVSLSRLVANREHWRALAFLIFIALIVFLSNWR